MTLSLRPSRFLATRERLEIVQRYDREGLAAQLQSHRWVGAYALAQLDDGAWEESEWYSAETAQGAAIVCHSRGGLGNATTLTGPAEAIAAILKLHPGYGRTFAIGEPQHLPALEAVHSLKNPRRMMRMLVTAETFRPARGEATPLLGAHVQIVNRLYNSEGSPTYYRREHIEDGCYWGVTDDERLVAIAGTHAIGRKHGIAILGNVFTHPRYRGRGHATLVTSAVTAALLEQVDDVVLSVDPNNEPAVRAYQRLGYRDVGPIVEASATKHAGPMLTASRRWLARQRGPGDEREIVYT